MSSEAEIQALKTLAALDAELAELESALSAEREAIDSKRAQLQELEDRVRFNSESIQELEKSRSHLLAELRQMSAQIDKAREKLARCRNEREANAAQRELEELRKLYRDREHEMEKLVGVADEVKGTVDVASKRREELQGELGQIQDASQKIDELQAAAEEKQRRRADISKGINQTIFRRYELIRKRRGSGLAQAIDGGCAACHIKFPAMLFQQIAQGGGPLQQCPSCNRILFFEQEPAATDSASNESEPEEPAQSREQKSREQKSRGAAEASDEDSGETTVSVDRAG